MKKMTIREHEGDDIDDEVQPSYFCGIPVKTIMDNVNGCGNWVITIGAAFLIVSPIILNEPDSGYSNNTSTSRAALGMFAAGMFSCAAGIACKVAQCCVEDEENMSEPEMVGMV
jgi:hypothetical protein